MDSINEIEEDDDESQILMTDEKRNRDSKNEHNQSISSEKTKNSNSRISEKTRLVRMSQRKLTKYQDKHMDINGFEER